MKIIAMAWYLLAQNSGSLVCLPSWVTKSVKSLGLKKCNLYSENITGPEIACINRRYALREANVESMWKKPANWPTSQISISFSWYMRGWMMVWIFLARFHIILNWKLLATPKLTLLAPEGQTKENLFVSKIEYPLTSGNVIRDRSSNHVRGLRAVTNSLITVHGLIRVYR